MDQKSIPKFSRESANKDRTDNTKGSSVHLGARGNNRREIWDPDLPTYEGESLASLAARFAKAPVEEGFPPPGRRPSPNPKDTATVLTYVGAAFFTAALSGGVLYYMLTSGGGASRSAGNGAHDASPTRTDDRNRGAATNRISFEANIIQPAPAPVLRPTPDPSLAAPNAASGSFAPNHSGADAVAKGAPLPDPLDDLDEGLAGRVRDPAGDTAMRPLAEDPDGRSAALSPPPVQTVPAERSFLPDAPAASDQPPTLTTRPDRPAPAATPQVKVSPEEEARMLKRAADFLNQNDIASARLIYKYLAERGSTVAADIYKRVQSRESGNSSSR